MRLQRVKTNVLVQLLTQNRFTHRQIATRVGCSPERVRQLELKLLGRTGHQAKQERRDQKFREKFEKINFVVVAKQKSLDVRPAKSKTGRWYDTRLYVNGMLCLLRRAYQNAGYKGKYVSIRKPSHEAGLCILEVTKCEFLIIPMREMPLSVTMFRASPAGINSLNETSWRKYLNNWDIFIQKT
jgi:hypothetical protein